MISFEATLEQFGYHGDKTHWTFITLPQEQAGQLHAADRKSFRVKGWIDAVPIAQIAVQPVKDGGYLLALNASLRRKLRKEAGQTVLLRLFKDESAPDQPDEFLVAIQSDPDAQLTWDQLTASHQRYYVNHIVAARTPETRFNRIAQSVAALANGWSFGEMIRAQKTPK
ncbi:MAG: DUF1905 domain-containing protein [Sphingobacteriales bacterium]|nr:MAG: DUF1905 domain-containing protein [Sphingobacteriales bacterium]